MTSPIVVRRAASDEGGEIGLLTLAAYRGDRVVDEEYAKELGDGTARVRDAHVLVAFAGLRMVGSVAMPPTARVWVAALCRAAIVACHCLSRTTDVPPVVSVATVCTAVVS